MIKPTIDSSPFTQILVKTSSTTQLKGFALKTFDQRASYPSFSTYLVEQLDFSRGTAKASDDLPPSVESLSQASTETGSACRLHSVRLGNLPAKKRRCPLRLVLLNCRRNSAWVSLRSFSCCSSYADIDQLNDTLVTLLGECSRRERRRSVPIEYSRRQC